MNLLWIAPVFIFRSRASHAVQYVNEPACYLEDWYRCLFTSVSLLYLELASHDYENFYRWIPLFPMMGYVMLGGDGVVIWREKQW